MTFDLEAPSDAASRGLDAGRVSARRCSPRLQPGCAARLGRPPLRLLHDDRPRPRRCLRGAPARGRAAGDRSRPWRLARRGRARRPEARLVRLVSRLARDTITRRLGRGARIARRRGGVGHEPGAGRRARRETARAELGALRFSSRVPYGERKGTPRPPARRAPGRDARGSRSSSSWRARRSTGARRPRSGRSRPSSS